MTLQFPLSNLRESIYGTIIYFDLFDYPLTLEEIEHFLLGKADQKKIEAFLKNDINIEKKNEYYYLKGRAQIIETRLARAVIATKLWKKIKRWLRFIQLVPFIKMVAVCNTLAFNNPTPESDIDLFIITAKNRLFLARTYTTILFSLLGIRRHGGKIAGRFCLSFYVSEDVLNLQSIQLGSKDIYLPYWIASLKPIYGYDVYQKFMQKNQWISTYFQHEIKTKNICHKKSKFCGFFAKMHEFIYKGNFGNWIEKKLINMQQKRHQKNLKILSSGSSVIINEKMLKFHNIDRRYEFAERFEKSFKPYFPKTH